jgi:phage terminase small subunit
MALTPKQQRFIEEYLIDLNATQAAIRAGYSQDTANVIGCENLTKPYIAEAIAKAQAERSQKTKIDAEWVLRKATEVVEHCMSEKDYNAAAAISALNLVGKHINVQAFSENLSLTGKNGGAIITANMQLSEAEKAVIAKGVYERYRDLPKSPD